ncbi:hypothetical protein [Flavobacterium cerinum]|uniref:Uncharacterized protein n=1 Tax=Flavobacterium cerinum TaxID=2502784 RepID=A0A3S3U1X2_9FLAO|nr:hypothetical protein [Flavobacterium cerinum]RWW98915.1 hypothetical protein EPI11_13400 [Flavobacterium cerinum]
MKNIFILLLASLSFSSYAQKQLIEKFVVANDTISYTSIDYSKYGLGVSYITMYEQSEDNKIIPDKAAKCLKRIKNLYHTFYYFIEVPKNYTQIMKEKIFAAFIEHVKIKDKLTRANLYLNFDKNYSQYYQKLHPNDEKGLEIQSIVTDITPATICKAL